MTVPHSYSETSKRKRRRGRSSVVTKTEPWLKTEICLKLAFNSILSVVAIASLSRLLPYQLTQQQKLKEVRVEIQDTESRVSELRDHLNRNFDPQQTRKIMQEQSPMIDPNQRRIIMVQGDNLSPLVKLEEKNDHQLTSINHEF